MIPATGWYVEIEDPDSGHIWTPDPIDVQGQPTVNDRPGIEITVPQRDRWRKLVERNPDTQVPLRVWKDGKRRPIDSLDDVRDQPDRSVLVGSGGSELRRRVSRDVDQQPVVDLVRELVDQETGYTPNVDDPPTTTTSDQQIASLSSTADFRNRLADPTATEPLDISGGSVGLYQSLWFKDDDGASASNRTSKFASNAFNGSVTELSSVGDYVEWTYPSDIVPQYRIDADNLGFRDHFGATGSDPPVVAVLVNGQELYRDPVGGGAGLAWRDQTVGSSWDPMTLAEGVDHDIRVEVVGSGADAVQVDALAIYDDRFSFTFADPPTQPEQKPDAVDVVFESVPAPQAVTGGRVDSAWSSTNSTQQLTLSNDQGDSFELTASDSTTLDGTFSSPAFGPSLTLKVTLSRGTSLQSVDLFADLESEPLVVNKNISGDLDGVLAGLAEQTNSVWEVRRDGSTVTVEWTKAGQRTTDADPALSGFEYETKTGDIVNKAIVFGRSQQRTGERIVADHGTAVPLQFGEVHEGAVTVRDPDTGKVYQQGPDYGVEFGDGAITVKSGGQISDGQTVAVDYRYQSRGEFDNGNGTPATTREIELPGLTTEMTCSQAARIIVDNLETPLREATATAPPEEIGWTVVEEIDPSDLPGSGLKVRALEPTPQDLSFRLGSRRSASELIGDLRGQLSTVSRRT